MDHELLANLAKVPGVIACAAFDGQGRCLAEVLPPPFERAILEAALDSVDRAVAALRPDGSPSGASLVVLAGSHGQLAVRFIGEAGLISVVEPTINMAMLSVAMNVVASRLGESTPGPRLRGPSVTLERADKATSKSTKDTVRMRAGEPVAKRAGTKETLKVKYADIDSDADTTHAAPTFEGRRFSAGEDTPPPNEADEGSGEELSAAPSVSTGAAEDESQAPRRTEAGDMQASRPLAPEDAVPLHVMKTLVNALRYVIGPAGLYVVRRTLSEWEIPPSALPRARYRELLDAVAERIPDHEERRRFMRRGREIYR